MISSTVSSARASFGFEEIGYLLMCGELPTRRQLEEFQHVIGLERALPDNFTEDMIMRAPSRDIMNKLASATLALYSYDSNPDATTVENIMRQGISLTAKFPVIISHAYQAKRRYFDGASMFLHVPDPERSTAENILHLIRPDGKYTDDEAKLLDRCLILHAEHGGGNNSTFTVRVTTSSGTDTYSAIAAAVSSLKASVTAARTCALSSSSRRSRRTSRTGRTRARFATICAAFWTARQATAPAWSTAWVTLSIPRAIRVRSRSSTQPVRSPRRRA